MHPSGRFRYIAHDALHGDVRDKTVIHGDEDKTFFDECCRLVVHRVLTALRPAAAMNQTTTGRFDPFVGR
jgi:hypothetical protein